MSQRVSRFKAGEGIQFCTLELTVSKSGGYIELTCPVPKRRQILQDFCGGGWTSFLQKCRKDKYCPDWIFRTFGMIRVWEEPVTHSDPGRGYSLHLVGGSNKMYKEAPGFHVLLKVGVYKTVLMLRTAVVSCTQATVAFSNTYTRWVRTPVAKASCSAHTYKQLFPSAITRFWGQMQIVRSMASMATGS